MSVNIGNHFPHQVLLCRQPDTSPAVQAAGYVADIAAICGYRLFVPAEIYGPPEETTFSRASYASVRGSVAPAKSHS